MKIYLALGSAMTQKDRVQAVVSGSRDFLISFADVERESTT